MTTPDTMIRRCSGLLGTSRVSAEESEFIEGLEERLNSGQVTRLSEKQLNWLRDIHDAHFAG
jgi:hypothetical protein